MKKFKMTIMLIVSYVLLGVHRFVSWTKYDLLKCETPEQTAIRRMVEAKMLDHNLFESKAQ